MSRHVRELQCTNVLDAAVRFQRDRQLPEDQAQPSPETGHRQEAHAGGKQRGQPRSHRGRVRQHRPDGAHLPGGLPGLLQEEHQPGAVRHRGPRVRAAR